MGMWTVVWFYMYGSEYIAVSEPLRSVLLSSHSIIIINHNYNTLSTLAKLLATPEIHLQLLTCMASLRAASPSPSALISLSIMLPLYSIILIPKPPSFPSLLLPVCHLFPLTVYLIQSKLLHSSQTLITASPNLLVCMPFHNSPFPITVCWGYTITPLHDRLPFCLWEPFSSNISAPTSIWHYLSSFTIQVCLPATVLTSVPPLILFKAHLHLPLL